MKHIFNVFLYVIVWGTICSPFSLLAQKPKKQPTLTQKDSIRLNDVFINATENFINGNYQQAIQQYNKVKNSYPNDDAIYHQLSKCYAGLDQIKKAIQYEDIAVDLQPSNKYYYTHLAGLLRKIKAWKQLATCYESMLTNCQGVDQYKYELAQIYFYYFQLGKQKYLVEGKTYTQLKIPKKERKELNRYYDRASTLFNQYASLYGTDLELTQDKQKLCLAADQFRKAVQEGEEYFKSHPKAISILLENADIVAQYESNAEAIAYLLTIRTNYDIFDIRLSIELIAYYASLSQEDKILQEVTLYVKSVKNIVDDKTTLLSQYAQTDGFQKNSTAVLELAQQLYREDSTNSTTILLLGNLSLATKDYKLAASYYKRSIGLDSLNKNAWYNLISCLVETKQTESALTYGKNATLLFPDDGEFYAYVFQLLRENGDHTAALAYLNKAIEHMTETGRLVSYLCTKGDLFYSIQQYDSAYAAYEEALVFAPNDALTLNNYSYYLALQKTNLKKAKSMAKRLILVNPNTPEFLDTYGWVLYQMEQYKEACLYLEKAASQRADAAIFEHYGDALYALNRTQESLIWWKKAAQLTPSSKLTSKIQKASEK